MDDVLNILANISRFGERGGIGNRERHVQQTSQCFSEQGFAGARGAHQQNIALREFDFVIAVTRLDTLVVVVNGHCKSALGARLTDDVLIQRIKNLAWLRQMTTCRRTLLFQLFADDVIAELNALIANEHTRASDQFANLVLALSAKRTVEDFSTVT